MAKKSTSSGGEVVPTQDWDFLELEYEQLNEWARHGEEAAHRIFNFYVSLLTAVLGGLLLIIQMLGGSLQQILVVGSITSGVLVLVSVTFLDALISQYIRNAHYRIGIERIRAHFGRDPDIAGALAKLPRLTLEADAERGFGLVDERLMGRMRFRWMRRLLRWVIRLAKLLLPVSTQQIFLSTMASLLLGALMLSLVWLVRVPAHPSGVFLACAIAVLLSFIAHNVFARLGLQDLFDRLREMSATAAEAGVSPREEGEEEKAAAAAPAPPPAKK